MNTLKVPHASQTYNVKLLAFDIRKYTVASLF
jgi:hypothetical protein